MRKVDILALILGIIGMVLIIVYGNWQVALGIFIFTWGNNVSNNNK